jgi:NADPH2:quinone reductase
MLRIADNKPEVLKRCLENVVELTEQGIFKPLAGKVFPVSEFASAHEFLEGRKSMGKVSLVW